MYLFATVPGSLSLELGFLSQHPVLSGLIVVAGVVLLVLVGRYFWQRTTKLRDELKSGTALAVLRSPWPTAARRPQPA